MPRGRGEACLEVVVVTGGEGGGGRGRGGEGGEAGCVSRVFTLSQYLDAVLPRPAPAATMVVVSSFAMQTRCQMGTAMCARMCM